MDTVAPDPNRRRLLRLAATGGLLFVAGCRHTPPGEVIFDVARLQPLPVARVARPSSVSAVSQALRDWPGSVSIGGGRFSMGGQIAAAQSLHLDMRGLDKLVWLDLAARTVRVQAGMRWRDLQALIDPHDLSVAIMQSYSSFSVGGSISVNCHGRYVGKGPVVNSVRALQLVTADGAIHELSRTQSPDWFAAAIGGYGGLGVITEVELDLDRNTPLRRSIEQVALDDYPTYFRDRVLTDPQLVLHNADLVPPGFDRPFAISWRRTDEVPTVVERLVPEGIDYGRDQSLIWAASELPGGTQLRLKRQGDTLREPPLVVWRNHEASLDVAALEPRTRAMSSYVLEEYFIPVDRFLPFARQMAIILARYRANVLNVSLRHSPRDDTTLMRWAVTDVFCFVLYYKQRATDAADRTVASWTRALIDAALAQGGRYYLPYRLHATQSQFDRAYPQARQFAAVKRTADPHGRFHNALWDKYLR